MPVDEHFEGLNEQYEYVQGTLVPRRGGNPRHARAVNILGVMLEQFNPHIDIYSALVLNVAREKYRVPDLCFYATNGPPADPFAAPSNPPRRVRDSLGAQHRFAIDSKRCGMRHPTAGAGLGTAALGEP